MDDERVQSTSSGIIITWSVAQQTRNRPSKLPPFPGWKFRGRLQESNVLAALTLDDEPDDKSDASDLAAHSQCIYKN